MKLHKLIMVWVGIILTFSVSATDLKDARIYINPGHGGWTANDRPMATINYAQMDIRGFFETNTNLIKGLALRDELVKAGAGFIKMSRTQNGFVSAGDKNATENDKVETSTQIVTLSVICEDVEANNMDYFISIHSNAATEGSMTNYPLVLYRGTDGASGNGLVNAKEMAYDAWKYIVKNEVTYHSAYTAETANNSRGDISFYGSSSTSGLGYTGYLGVLKHGCDGFLSEGCFHTYQPERQRLLNEDYCRQEGVRYSRAIRAWFNDNSETKGCIMGTVKDISKPLEHPLYTYKVNSVDAYYPLNDVKVVLEDANGNKIGEYLTDKEYNGIFVFTELTPGTYKLVFDIEGYWKETEEIEVVANETSFINKRLTDTSKEEPSDEPVIEEVDYYPHPVQDGDIAAARSYHFTKEGELQTVEVLKDLTVRRAILRDGKYYVLAVNGDKMPRLLVLDPVTGELLKEMSTEGIKTEGFNGKAYPYILSDITFTTDGVLLGTNSTVIGKEGNSYQTGDFYMYKWQATENKALEEATPEVLLTLPTNTSASLLAAGNNNSNFMANSIAVNGTLDNFKFYFDSHAGNGWSTTYGIRYLCWQVKDGQVIGTQYNDTEYTEKELGADVQMTLSPLGIDRLIVDGNSIAPREFRISWDSNDGVEVANFAGDIPVESTGANYFRYANKIYMSVPVCEKKDEKYSYKSYLYDVTDGLDKAVNVGETEAVITNDAITYMASVGVVDNADIVQHLLVGLQAVSYTTKGVEQDASPARIFAYNLKSVRTNDGYDISFDLNEKAEAIDLILIDVASGAVVKTISLGAFDKVSNKVSLAFADIPDVECTWELRATAGNVTRFVKLSDDSKNYHYFAPKGVSIDKSPESPYFGRVYVTNTAAGEASGRTTATGVYVMGPDALDITGQGDKAYAGDVQWTGVVGEGPRKVAVAADGRVFLCDASSSNAGVYLMNPETFTISPVFKGATNEAGSLSIGGVYVGGQMTAIGVRGTGEATQLYTVDKTTSGASWKKFINVYNIGEADVWTTAPSYSKAASSYIGNDNSSIVPVSTGYWAGQYRGAGGNSTANPCMFYFSDELNDAVFNTAEPNIVETSSQNGALAVNEKEGIVALSNNGGVSIFQYKMNKDGIPAVSEKFRNMLGSVADATYDDFEFDYAGNLYAVSTSGKIVSVWAMPTDNNSCVTPAKKTMTLKKKDDVGVQETEVGITRIYPNPVDDVATIESSEVIDMITVYNASGTMVDKQMNVNANTTAIDFSRFAKGLYFVKLNNQKAIKVIKK